MAQRSDPLEMPGALGPLFARNDPPTSRKAAEAFLPRLTKAQTFALGMVTLYPGSNSRQLGEIAHDNDPLEFQCGIEGARQRIGRRLNELEKAGLIRREGERDGCSLWWPVTP